MSKLTQFLDFIQPYILATDMIFIHAIIALPFICILINFLNGGCDVAESAGLYNAKKGKLRRVSNNENQDQDQDEGEEEEDEEDENNENASFLQNPRVTVALMFVAFFWQIHAVWFVADRYLTFGLDAEVLSIEKYLANPSLTQGFVGIFAYTFQKIWKPILHLLIRYIYIAHGVGCLGYLLCCVVIWKRAADERRKYDSITTHKKYMKTFFPQGGKEKEALDYLNPKSDTTRISFCSRCRTPIIGRDHHCRWLGTCIGASSRIPYVLSLIFGFMFAAADVLLGTVTMPILNDAHTQEKLGDVTIDRYYILVGYVFSIAVTFFLAWQGGVQFNLLRLGQTKLGRKGRREAYAMKQEKAKMKKDI